jgi:hypothetical protein
LIASLALVALLLAMPALAQDCPEPVGFYDTPGEAIGVAVAGSYAYVADEDAGLRVVNVSNPAVPFEVGFYDTPGEAIGVAVAGAYAYVADGLAGLRVVNVSNPAVPFEVGSYNTPVYAVGVAVAGSYAYVADGDAGLRVVNVSNPAAPFEVGFYYTPGFAYGVAVAGSYAYVAHGDDGHGLRVVDVSNPAAPFEVGSYDTPRSVPGITTSQCAGPAPSRVGITTSQYLGLASSGVRIHGAKPEGVHRGRDLPRVPPRLTRRGSVRGPSEGRTFCRISAKDENELASRRRARRIREPRKLVALLDAEEHRERAREVAGGLKNNLGERQPVDHGRRRAERARLRLRAAAGKAG